MFLPRGKERWRKVADKESNIVKRVMKEVSKRGARLFRNNIGQAFYPDGSVVRYGLCYPGGSDLIGWHPVVITPEMVGKKVAVFVAVEVKGPRGRLSPEQRNFIKAVAESGGIAGVARSEKDALDLLP